MRPLSALLLECCGKVVWYMLCSIILFLPYAMLGLVFGGEAAGALFIVCFAALVGALLGICQFLVGRFSEQLPVTGKPTSLANDLLWFYLSPLLPWWGQLTHLIWVIATKDYSRQKPGRWKRGLVVAAWSMLVIGLLVVVTERMTSSPTDAMFLIVILGMSATLGGVAGALTDCR